MTGVLEIDENDVGVDGVDAGQQLGSALDAHDINVTGLAQALLQDRGANRVLVNDNDVEGCIHRHALMVQALCQPRRCKRWPILKRLPL